MTSSPPTDLSANHADHDGTVGWRSRLRLPVIVITYLLLSAVYAWPVLRHLDSRIASDTGDPALNTMIIWWNATTLPFTDTWWNGLHYYPVQGVSALTENLAGLAPFTTPLYWLSGSPLVTYNLMFVATWPLNAFATFLLVRFLSKRDDVAFLAGLAFAFTPYRGGAPLSHIQTLSSFWMPLCLLGMHGYLRDRRVRWLLLFGVTWALQSLANGHYMLFGAVLLACWIGWFCSTPATWRAGATLVAAWILASLPLVPIMNVYRLVHAELGLTRSLNELKAFSATLGSWAEVSPRVWLWGARLHTGDTNLFPGAVAITVALVAVAVLLFRPQPGPPVPPGRHALLAFLGLVTVVSAAAILLSLSAGRWDITIGGLEIRMGSLTRALLLLFAGGLPLVGLIPHTREILRRRSTFAFYTVMIFVIAVFCFGPVIRGGGDEIFSSPPYAWLLVLPGYSGVRVLTRFWVLALLCLSVAASLGFAHLVPRRSRLRGALVALMSSGLLLDGWVTPMPTEPAVESWSTVEATGSDEPILELPAGGGDYHATFRTTTHRRRVFNGVSGHNPPHYIALLEGLGRQDAAMLAALASLTAFDAVVDRRADPDGVWARFASNAAGASLVGDDGLRLVYRIPRAAAEPGMGPSIRIVHVDTVRHQEAAPLMFDGRLDTGWGDYPQAPDQWVRLDLGRVWDVGGLTHVIGEYQLDYPKQLIVETSIDGQTWEPAREGPVTAPTVLALLRGPREGAVRLPFSRPRAARYVMLRQVEKSTTMWRISEIRVHAPRTP